MSRLARFPFFVILMGLAGLAMLPPAIMAAQSGLFASARAFFYSGALLLMLTVMLAMALSGYRPKNVARSHLLTLVGAYLGLPAVFAVPFHQAVGRHNLAERVLRDGVVLHHDRRQCFRP